MKKPSELIGLILLLLFGFSRIGFAYDSTEKYEKRQLEGWTIRIHQDLLKDSELSGSVLRLLEFQLYQITRVVPAPALAKLRETPIWVELDDPKFPCMCYHPSADWLREHDVNPEKAGAVELSNAKNFLSWTKAQPWMVLHEMAHSYHHRVLGHDNKEILSAFAEATASGKYESVMNIKGSKVRHYALNNDREYFAEATEAFFGTNDFYPFTRAELKQHDAKIFAVLEKLWWLKGNAETQESPLAKDSNKDLPSAGSPPPDKSSRQ